MRSSVYLLPLIALALQAPLQPARAADSTDRTVSVVATAEVHTMPDLAVVQLGVTTRGDNAQAAMARNSEAMTQVQDAIIKLGVLDKDKDLQTSYVSLSPIYSNPQPQNPGVPPPPPQLIGFEANNVLAATLHNENLAKVGMVIDAAVGAGANQVQGISFTLADDQQWKIQALQQAGARARAKADALAAGLGVAVDHVGSAMEAEYQVLPADRGVAAPAPSASPVSSTPVLPGEIIVRAQVQVQFVLK